MGLSTQDEGEQIFKKGTTPGQTFGLWGLSLSSRVPVNLEQDKKHLEPFGDAWGLYSSGRVVYAEAKRVQEETRQMVRKYLTSPQNEIEPPARLTERLVTNIIEKIEARNRFQLAPDFEGHMMGVQTTGSPELKIPAVDFETLEELWTSPQDWKWTLEKAQKLAKVMTEVMSHQDLQDMVKKMRAAWLATTKNKDDFLRAKDRAVQRATSSNYQAPELTAGVCDDCKPLKEKLIHLEC